MISQTGQKIITMSYCPIFQEVKTKAMKLGQVIEYNVKNIFFKNHAENEARRLVADLVLFLKKTLYKFKASGQHLSFDIF